MQSIDTNILLAALDSSNLLHARASSWLLSISESVDVVISEFVLFELYGLLRNPTVLLKPLSAPAAVSICQALRRHPRWQLVGFPDGSRSFHNDLWPQLAGEQFARRRAYDLRLARSLIVQGVTEFATVNLKDFSDVGFKRVFNPLSV
jgi:uncharacterized protein